MPYRMKLADLILEIDADYIDLFDASSVYVVPNSAQRAADIHLRVTKDDIQAEETLYRASQEESVNQAYSEEFLKRLHKNAVLRSASRSLIGHNVLLMHGVLLATKGEGYLICAPSGTGKTTRACIWADEIPESTIVNGDKPFVKVTEDGLTAYGSPWSGKENWNVAMSVPLRAIFFLERSEDANEVEELSFTEAFPMLLRQTYRPKDTELGRKVVHLIAGMSGKVKLYKFKSMPTAEAVRLAYETAVEG